MTSGRPSQQSGGSSASPCQAAPLYSALTAVKEKFGTRAKLVDAICEIEKRAKDEGFKKRLLGYPVPRLFDAYRSAAKRAGIRVEVKPVVLRSASGGEAPKAAPAKAPKEAKAAAKPAAKKKAPAAKASGKKAGSKGASAKKKGR
jgi:hypothetical protein